jgi:tetratricopeptide (TPR) repeat protein
VSIESLFAEAFAAHQRGDLAKAERGYRGLIRSKPLEARHNLGLVLTSMGRLDAAEAVFREALEIAPNPRTEYAMAELLLSQGRYPEGWRFWEARRGIPELQVPDPRRDLDYGEWKGEDLAGKRLLVLHEQGFGDKIMLARYFPLLKAKGAEIVFFCAEALHPLMARLGVDLLGSAPPREALAADYWVLQGSLPGLLGTTVETVPPPTDFAIPLGSGGAIGVVVQGSAAHKNNANRSLFGRHATRLLKLGRDLSPEATGARDFAETAEIVKDLDLVISVDTANAHLAASLGKPTWVLLPAEGVDWRWLRGREDSPWYPSVRLFRQRAAGDWDPVIRRIEAALASR